MRNTDENYTRLRGTGRLLRYFSLMLALFTTSGCSGEEEYTYLEDGHSWSIYATAPFYYDVYVERINGINESQDWVTSHTQLRRKYDTKLERIDYAKYKKWAFDPFGLELYGNYVNRAQAINSKVNAPERVFIAWLSLAEGKFYQLIYYLSPELRQTILHNLLYKDKGGLDCSSKLSFGFIPSGEVNIWLGACGKYTYIERVKAQLGPLDEAYEKGNMDLYYPNLIRRQREKAEADGVTLFPIPPERLEHMRNSNTTPGSPFLHYRQPKPIPLSHCWAEKPYRLKVKLEKGSPQYQLSRRIWNHTFAFAKKVHGLNAGIDLAWQEAEGKGFKGRQIELWVLARLSAQGQVPATDIAVGLGLNTEEVTQVQAWADEFCRLDAASLINQSGR